LQVLRLDGERHLFALLGTFLLVRSCSAESGIKGDIRFIFACRTRLDVAAALAFGVGARTPSAVPAGDLV
jgi:hypothetical protein